jgi:hypothetical protein
MSGNNAIVLRPDLAPDKIHRPHKLRQISLVHPRTFSGEVAQQSVKKFRGGGDDSWLSFKSEPPLSSRRKSRVLFWPLYEYCIKRYDIGFATIRVAPWMRQTYGLPQRLFSFVSAPCGELRWFRYIE